MWEFDWAPDRTGTGNIKHDCTAAFGKPEGVLPMWVADMDFAAPEPVRKALAERCAGGVFGYGDSGAGYAAALQSWFARRQGWETEPDWVVKTPGVVCGIAIALRALTAPGEAVLLQTPIYAPFFSVIRQNGRRVVENPLVLDNGAYSIDFADFEAKIQKEKVKLFLLCSPHNPTGRVWRAEELRRMGEICLRHGVTVISDEIHGDLILPGHVHTPFLLASPASRDSAIVCTAPSKTFNLAGLQCSNLFIPNPELRRRFCQSRDTSGISGPNVLGLLACETAYRACEPWLEALLAYLAENLAYLRDFLHSEVPQVKLIEPQGTYLAWLDFRALGLTDPALDDLLLRRAGLWLDEGHIFGAQGSGFQRMVYACPRKTLEEALTRLSGCFPR